MEPFTILVKDRAYEVSPYVKGYTVSFHVMAEDSRIIFELDEEDQLRALTSGEPVSPELVGQLADAITRHFAK
jgi:hypothetical protein